MNADLKLRLRPLYALSPTEDRFFWHLVIELGCEAQRGLTVDAETSVHVEVETIENGEDDSAYVIGDGENFALHIDKRMPFGMITDFLIHELAHTHSWHVADPNEDHCDEFGLSYALLYRKYLELYDTFWSTP